MDVGPMGAEAFDTLMAAPKEPAVGEGRCCGFTFDLKSIGVPVSMVVRCPGCGQVWEVLST